MTPYQLSILLHYYVSPEPFKYAPILEETVRSFLDVELIKVDGDTYILTEKGRKYIKMVLNTPLPIIIDPRRIK
jgi:hypothetical protein